MGTRNIILVDDDISILESFKIILDNEGHNTLQAVNGKELFRLLEMNVPDLILLDYSLPGETGGELTSKIKSDPKYSLIPIIIISANGKFRMAALESGANEFLEKPLDIPFLLTKINDILS